MHNAACSVVASGRGGPCGKGSRGMGSERNETHYQVLLLYTHWQEYLCTLGEGMFD